MTYVLGVVVSMLLSLVVSTQSSGLAEARNEMSAATLRGDRPAFARFLSDDIASIDSAGKLRDKAAAVDEMPRGSSQVAADIREHGDGAVVAIGLPGESPARIIQAWARKGSQWQMVAFQGVRAGRDVTPATQPSSALPVSSGPEPERRAIQKTLDALEQAARVGDAQMWGVHVTDTFVAASPIGEFQRKDDVMRDIAGRANAVLSIRDISLRIHGTLAAATMHLRAQDLEFWRTAILVSEAGKWRIAAEITTPITGAARSAPQ